MRAFRLITFKSFDSLLVYLIDSFIERDYLFFYIHDLLREERVKFYVLKTNTHNSVSSVNANFGNCAKFGVVELSHILKDLIIT